MSLKECDALTERQKKELLAKANHNHFVEDDVAVRRMVNNRLRDKALRLCRRLEDYADYMESEAHYLKKSIKEIKKELKK